LEKRLRPPKVARLAHPELHQPRQSVLGRGLTATASLWPAIGKAYEWVHRAAHILANHEEESSAAVRRAYENLLEEMVQGRDKLGLLAPAIAHFQKVSASYGEGLFHCYAIPDLPRTNNDLEQCFGSVRYHERRATGRRGAVPGVVVRGSVRVIAAVATRCRYFSASDLRPSDHTAWLELREQLAYRREARRAQLRFRRKPEAYLAALEEQLLKIEIAVLESFF
jgi:hypothetical protein